MPISREDRWKWRAYTATRRERERQDRERRDRERRDEHERQQRASVSENGTTVTAW